MDLAGTLMMLHRLEKKVETNFLTSEGKILCLIKTEPGHNIKYYLNKSGLSYRGFYNALTKLRKANMVEIIKSSYDSRMNLIF